MNEASLQMHWGFKLQLAGRAVEMQDMAPDFCFSVHIRSIHVCRHIQLGMLPS
jgi:hypothetical protein